MTSQFDPIEVKDVRTEFQIGWDFIVAGLRLIRHGVAMMFQALATAFIGVAVDQVGTVVAVILERLSRQVLGQVGQPS